MMPDWYGFSLGTSDYPYYTYQGWKDALTRPETQQWRFNVHRLHFYMDDGINEIPDATIIAQLENCLRAIGEEGAQAVLDCHNYASNGLLAKLGSAMWQRKWLAIVNYFKNDPRVIAWELYNEPNWNYVEGQTAATAEYVEAVMKGFYDLSVQIRQIDPNRPICWATYFNQTSGGSKRWSPNNSPAGIDYTQLIQNIVLADHPYDYGACTTWEQLLGIWNYRLTHINMWRTTCPNWGFWIGEIETHPTGTSDTLPMEERIALEEQYVATVLSYAYENKLGFAYWKYPYGDFGANADRVIDASSYTPPPAVMLPFRDDFANLQNWTPISGTWNVLGTWSAK